MTENPNYVPESLWNERGKPNNPEILLWHEVLASGIKGALNGSPVQMDKDWDWFFGLQDYWQCFEHACQITDMDPERIRRGVVKEFYERSKLTCGPKYISYRKDILVKFKHVFERYL